MTLTLDAEILHTLRGVLGDRLVVSNDGCLHVTGIKPGTGGYVTVRFGGRRWRAHRLAYQTVVGDIPAGLVLDHLCRNRACCNPFHVEPTTIAENVLRGVGHVAENKRKTHCKYGHPFSGDNLILVPRGRRCRACDHARKREAYVPHPRARQEHGYAAYSRGRCRCKVCLRAWMEYRHNRAALRKAEAS